MINTIILASFSDVLTSRTVGMEVRKLVKTGQKNILDFSGIKMVTHSFCDEVFGKIFAELGPDGFKETLGFKNINSTQLAIIKGSLASHEMAPSL